MKTSIVVLILAFFVAGVASEIWVELFVQESCCQENEKNKQALIQALAPENDNLLAVLDTKDDKENLLALPDAKDDKKKDPTRLLRDQEEERLVDEFLKGRELAGTGCQNACRNKPTGNWCLVVCKGIGRRLADDNTVAMGVDTFATTSTTTPALRDRRAKSNNKATVETKVRTVQEAEDVCLEFPMRVPALIRRVMNGVKKLEKCKLKKECLVLRQCVAEDTN